MIQGLQWDIFCKVIDNFGDIGVAWRLAADLAGRGHRVRLWVDDTAALAWMAPGGCDRVQVLPWAACPDLTPAHLEASPTDVLVESFGCDVAPEFIALYAGSAVENSRRPLWINLEYLSAERYVERCHGLPSRVASGPAAGWTKWFFYPGFTKATGGLLAEPDLVARQAGFDRVAWLASHGIDAAREKTVSLFCYEPDALAGFLAQLARHGLDGQPVRLLVAAGRAASAVKSACTDEMSRLHPTGDCKLLSISFLPLLTQTDFDHLLWACDLNFVRGEDSLVRAVWAGKPFVWHIYPQDGRVHLDKLDAFLDMLQAPAALRRFHQVWNGTKAGKEELRLPQVDLPGWLACAQAARSRLLRQNDLTTSLSHFAAKNR